MTTIFKFDYNGDIRRFSRNAIFTPTGETMTFRRLKAIAMESYPSLSSQSDHWYFYLDDEDDKITIANDRDVTEFLIHADKSVSTVKVYIRSGETASTTPSLVATPVSKATVETTEPTSDSDEFVVVGNAAPSTPPAVVHVDIPVIPATTVVEQAPPTLAPAAYVAPTPTPPPAAAADTTPSTLSDRVQQLLKVFNLEHLGPMAVGWLELLRLTGDERVNYLLTVLSDKKFVDFVATYKDSDAYKQLKSSLESENEGDLFDETLFEKRLSEVQTTFIKPLLELFPELVIHFPILGADISVEGTATHESETVHRGVTCDGCGLSPIVGPRFKCTSCPNFDFCIQCRHERSHDPAHPFEQIEREERSSFPPGCCGGGVRYGRRHCGPSPFGRHCGTRGPFGGPFRGPFGGPFRGPFGGGAPAESIPIVGWLSFLQHPAAERSSRRAPCCGPSAVPAKPTEAAGVPKPTVTDEKTREALRNEQAIKAAIEESLKSLDASPKEAAAGVEESKDDAVDPRALLVEKWGDKLEMLNTMGLCDDLDECLTLLDQKNGDLRAVVEALFR